MIAFVLGKLCRAALTLWLVVTVTFFGLRAAGDPTLMLLPDNMPADLLALYRARWGFDQPLWVQYWSYLSNVATGDFGIAFADGRNALLVVLERLPATLTLATAAILVALVLGVGGGIVAAVKRGTAVDAAISTLAITGFAVPSFFLGILMILLLSMQLHLLPSSGYGSPAHLVMPALTLGLLGATGLARVSRAAMLEVLGQPYMATVRAKGLPYAYQVLRHALPNAAIPIVTVLGLNIGQLLSGAVITETVFAWPGIGRLIVTAAAAREVSVVQAVLLVVAVMIVTVNLLTDAAYGWLNPKIRRPR